MSTHEELMELAVEVAEFLLKVRGVERIGLLSRAPRGRDPSNIYLIVYETVGAAKRHLRATEGAQRFFHAGFGILGDIGLLTGRQLHQLERLMFGMSWDEHWGLWLQRWERGEVLDLRAPNPVGFFVLPLNLDADFLRRFERLQPRPGNFWRDAAKGYEEFDCRRREFLPAVPPWQ